MPNKAKIVPHLWFDTEALEAARFYTAAFAELWPEAQSEVTGTITLPGTPSGDAVVVTARLAGQEFMLLSAGPYFKFTPAVSFLIACDSAQEVDTLWEKFSEGGQALMELGEYPFSKRYGWLKDRYGLSWQIMLGQNSPRQRITPTLMFVGQQAGKAEEAINFYSSVFHESSTGHIMRYEAEEKPEKEGTIKHAGFTLEGMEFAAMDSAQNHEFAFNEAVSFIVNCETQEEIDYYWEKLSAVPEAEQCGWLKDRYGLSWQIVPAAMDEMYKENDAEKIARVTEAFLKMKKFDIAALRQAAEGK